MGRAATKKREARRETGEGARRSQKDREPRMENGEWRNGEARSEKQEAKSEDQEARREKQGGRTETRRKNQGARCEMRDAKSERREAGGGMLDARRDKEQEQETRIKQQGASNEEQGTKKMAKMMTKEKESEVHASHRRTRTLPRPSPTPTQSSHACMSRQPSQHCQRTPSSCCCSSSMCRMPCLQAQCLQCSLCSRSAALSWSLSETHSPPHSWAVRRSPQVLQPNSLLSQVRLGLGLLQICSLQRRCMRPKGVDTS